MPGPLPKPPEERQRRNRRDLGAVAALAGEIPAAPSDLGVEAVAAWSDYWGDVVAGVVRPADSSLAVRWARNLDRYHRILALADAEPVTIGSTGQPKANPLYDLAYKIESSVRADEQQLGIGPLARLRLGVKLAEAQTSLADLAADIDAEGVSDDDDPRSLLTG
jgi:P27 family predicted phage terminase small subunit